MVAIRALRSGDEDRLFALVSQLGHALIPDRAAFDATIAAYLSGEQPAVTLLVAEDDAGVVQGYALATIVPLLSTNGLAAQLQELVVDRGARGLDLGSALVHAIEEVCRAKGVTQLTVASRRAGGFYDRLGFHESAEYMRRFF
jgi:GNAT superfamily N-acetyltransferase